MSDTLTFSVGQTVTIFSPQTPRSSGRLIKIENDPRWGPQYLVRTVSEEWGPEDFWFRENEIAPTE